VSSAAHLADIVQCVNGMAAGSGAHNCVVPIPIIHIIPKLVCASHRKLSASGICSNSKSQPCTRYMQRRHRGHQNAVRSIWCINRKNHVFDRQEGLLHAQRWGLHWRGLLRTNNAVQAAKEASFTSKVIHSEMRTGCLHRNSAIQSLPTVRNSEPIHVHCFGI